MSHHSDSCGRTRARHRAGHGPGPLPPPPGCPGPRPSAHHGLPTLLPRAPAIRTHRQDEDSRKKAGQEPWGRGKGRKVPLSLSKGSATFYQLKAEEPGKRAAKEVQRACAWPPPARGRGRLASEQAGEHSEQPGEHSEQPKAGHPESGPPARTTHGAVARCARTPRLPLPFGGQPWTWCSQAPTWGSARSQETVTPGPVLAPSLVHEPCLESPPCSLTQGKRQQDVPPH